MLKPGRGGEVVLMLSRSRFYGRLIACCFESLGPQAGLRKDLAPLRQGCFFLGKVLGMPGHPDLIS